MVDSIVERRIYKRRLVNIPVTYEYNQGFHRDYIKDISCGGAFIVTGENIPLTSPIKLRFSVPQQNTPLELVGKIIRTDTFFYKKNICTPKGIAIKFDELSLEKKIKLQEFINNKKIVLRPELKIHFEPRFCYLYAMDFSLGCDNNCIYCHFSTINKNDYIDTYKQFPVSVDITSLYVMENIPSPIFLSPASDPFSKENSDLAYEVLSYLLPKGIVFIILTKCVIPNKVLELIKKYKKQFEGIGIGLTNLDKNRNKIIEPNCPSAEDRIECLKQLIATGVDNVRLRMDPLFPFIDDLDDNLNSIVNLASKIGVKGITATYIFSFGDFLKRLKNEPFLKGSAEHINEKSPMAGGNAFTVSLERKLLIYNKLFSLCNAKNINFNTCGCKESRLNEMGFSLTCRNPDFYQKEDKL